MLNTVQDIMDAYSSIENKVEFLDEQITKTGISIDNKLQEVDDLAKARWTITEVQRVTQSVFKDKVEKLVTMALREVYSHRELGFELVFEDKRNQMEVKPVLYEIIDGKKEIFDDPEFDTAGGIIDVISFALRPVLWSMEKPRSRNVFILDEPFKNMGAMIVLGGKILRAISHELGFQLIIITHDQELIDIADRAWEVEYKNGKSKVYLLGGE